MTDTMRAMSPRSLKVSPPDNLTAEPVRASPFDRAVAAATIARDRAAIQHLWHADRLELGDRVALIDGMTGRIEEERSGIVVHLDAAARVAIVARRAYGGTHTYDEVDDGWVETPHELARLALIARAEAVAIVDERVQWARVPRPKLAR